MSTQTKFSRLDRLRRKSSFSAQEARAAGVHPSLLAYYVKKGLLEKIGRGVYRDPHAEIDVDFKWEDLVIVANSIPNGVVCLVSALAIYELTEEIPRRHWIAVPNSTTAPKRPLIRVVRMRDMTTGKTTLNLGGEKIQIFSRERTIIDAFRYLSIEVAIKSLKMAVGSEQGIDLVLLQRYAKSFRVSIGPYLMAVTT